MSECTRGLALPPDTASYGGGGKSRLESDAVGGRPAECSSIDRSSCTAYKLGHTDVCCRDKKSRRQKSVTWAEKQEAVRSHNSEESFEIRGAS